MPMQIIPLDDLEIPMWAREDQALQEAKRKRNEHWHRMRKAKLEWLNYDPDDGEDIQLFWPWLEDTYGLRAHRNSNGDITEGYEILDEKKYTLFLLKYSQ